MIKKPVIYWKSIRAHEIEGLPKKAERQHLLAAQFFDAANNDDQAEEDDEPNHPPIHFWLLCISIEGPENHFQSYKPIIINDT